MLDFFNRLFNPAPPSGATAKERLRLVLLSDHLQLAPDVIEALKRDLLVVISRYVEIDQAHADVTFEHREGEVAMLASIPITGVRERRREEPPQIPPIAAATVPPVVQPALSVGDAGSAPLEAHGVDATSQAPSPARRRRRRKASAAKRAAAQASVQMGNPAQA